MSQRLVRAKTKIRDACIPFRVPDPPDLDERVSFVLDAIYSAYTTGWDSLNEAGSTHHALAAEAISIGRTLVQLMPDEPEAHGLLALVLHCEARHAARYTNEGEFVPLDQQKTALWCGPMMEEAESHLRTAAGFKRMGRYQLEAAIQSIHASRAQTGSTDWQEIALLYEGVGSPVKFFLPDGKLYSEGKVLESSPPHILSFHRLSYEHQLEIAEKFLLREVEFLASHGHKLELDKTVPPFLVRKGFRPKLGARPMRDAVEKLLGDAVANCLLRARKASGVLNVDEARDCLTVR